MSNQFTPVIEAVSGFNTLSSEIRARIETLVKQILFLSGGVQTITISAFLSAEKPHLAESTIALLKSGWLQLSASIILCLLFMLLQVLSLIHVGIKHKSLLSKVETEPSVKVMSAWLPLRILNWIVGLSAFLLCVCGVYTISIAAISLISA